VRRRRETSMRKIPSAILLLLLLTMMLFCVFRVLPAKASGKIYINRDGSITPSTANITTPDYHTYTFTGNNYLPIVVNRSNIIINGNRHTVQASGGTGFSLTGLRNVTIENTYIMNSSWGIYLGSSSNNILSSNSIKSNTYGIDLDATSNNNIISSNNVTANSLGVFLYTSSNNTLSNNSIRLNTEGINIYNSSANNILSGNDITANKAESFVFYISSGNRIFHNNFVNNTGNCINCSETWDNGYPSGGNYWSIYGGADLFHGVNQNLNGSDGIGDTPYIISPNNTDHYPLRGEYGSVTLKGNNAAVFPSYDLGLIFQSVTTAGSTTANSTSAGPVNHPINGSRVGEYLNIKTTASYSGKITVRIQFYDPKFSNLTRENLYKSSLRLMHWDNVTQKWVDITTGIDVVSNVIYGQTDHFSIFGVTSVFGVTGDINQDGTVNVLDLIIIAHHLGHANGDGHTPYSSDWYNCMNSDINGDGTVNVLDLIKCASHLGQHWP
jgi:parallel beta-helix repeat protein